MEKVLMSTDQYKLVQSIIPGKDEHREQLKGINLTDKHIEVTDGRMALRLRRDCLSLPDLRGVYKIISAVKFNKTFTELVIEKQEEAQYPDMDAIWPSVPRVDDCINIEILPEKTALLSISSAMVRLFKYTESAFCHEYIARLAALACCWKVYKSGKDKQALFISECGRAEVVILPFKWEE